MAAPFSDGAAILLCTKCHAPRFTAGDFKMGWRCSAYRLPVNGSTGLGGRSAKEEVCFSVKML